MIVLFNKLNDCHIDPNAVIGRGSSFRGVSAGYGTYISANATIRNTEIGKFCSVGPNLLCGFGMHPLHGISTSPAFYSTGGQNGFTFSKENKVVESLPVFIGNDVFIGANVTILDGVTIGDGAVIGAGATVSKDIPPYAIAVGCPIKVLRFRFSADIIEKLLRIKWWDRDEKTLRDVERSFFNVSEFADRFDTMEYLKNA